MNEESLKFSVSMAKQRNDAWSDVQDATISNLEVSSPAPDNSNYMQPAVSQLGARDFACVQVPANKVPCSSTKLSAPRSVPAQTEVPVPLKNSGSGLKPRATATSCHIGYYNQWQKNPERNGQSLRQHMESAIAVSFMPGTGGKWLPWSHINRIFTVERIAALLKDLDDTGKYKISKLSEIIYRTCPCLFASLFWAGLESKIFELVEQGVTDNDLLTASETADAWEEVLAGVPVFDSWSLREKDLLSYCRRYFLVPRFFREHAPNQVCHLKLYSPVVLPWTVKRHGGSGQHGQVTVVTMDPDHHDFPNEGSLKDCFAIKKLRLYNPDISSDPDEVVALKQMNSKDRKHAHVIELLATFKKDQFFYLIFPVATHSLIEFWDYLKAPKLNHIAPWVAEQFLGLADGLAAIDRKSVV